MSQTAVGIRVALLGRITQVRQLTGQSGTTFLTLLRTPAPDEYTSPGTFEVRSKRRLGAEGQQIEVECTLAGYAKSYERKSDGQAIRTAEHVLTVE